MCNEIHKEHEAIKKTGFGWKLFRISGGKFYPLCKPGHFVTPTKEWAVWNKENINSGPNDKGFCFFLDEQEARYTLRLFTEEEFVNKTRLLS